MSVAGRQVPRGFPSVIGAGKTALHLLQVRCALGPTLTLDIPELQIAHGERVAIIGPNGAGKSSLLRLISGCITPHQGTVTVLGQSLPAAPPELRRLHARVGQVHQGLHLVQALTALDNVLIGALGRLSGWRSWARWHHADDIAHARAALARVGLTNKALERVSRLSGGERQKVAIARMQMQQPELILADEPTAALDPQAARDVATLLAGASSDTAHTPTLISIVHHPEMLPLMAERVIGLKAGRIVFDLPQQQLDPDRLQSLYDTSK